MFHGYNNVADVISGGTLFIIEHDQAKWVESR